MPITLFQHLENLSRESTNGSIRIILTGNNESEIADLSWEDIVDIEHALKLAKEVQNGGIILSPKYKAMGLNSLDHFGENLPSVYNKFEFLLKYFVGSFDY